MQIARLNFNPARYVQTEAGNVSAITPDECERILAGCFSRWLEPVAEYIEDKRPDLWPTVDRVMVARGFEPPEP